ncbi:hypothetical protein SAMN06264364_102140 [Quadrisphaera granulorum]|uniref:Uncharacterized protein n=1 Tax=Quadrisphaera granulorum TaxID=317664 RepID=A0A316AFT9_9ACTN|nr:hypothetical protein BXY45_102140 [Quadrisphaera granulorum]SZE95271.1 hypothetical protein SAMN06264364_102140 [Quadrisphaera granulorum]
MGPGRPRLVVLLGAAALALAPAALAPTALAPAALASPVDTGVPAVVVGHSGIGLELTQIGPAALVPGSQLVVRVQVVNTSASPLVGARARLFVNSPVLADRKAVDAWAAGQGVQGGDRFAGVDGAEQPLGQTLAPGEGMEVTFTVDADQLALGPDFGVRGVTVDVLDSSLQRLTALRTFVVWAPPGSVPTPAAFTVVAPVTAGPPDVDTGQLPEARVEEQRDRLTRVLQAMSLPGTTPVVDPALLGPFAVPTQQSTTPPSSGSTSSPSGTPSGTPGTGSSSSPTDSTTTPPPASTPAQSASPNFSASGTTAPSASSAPSDGEGTGDVPELREGTEGEESPEVQAWLTALAARTSGASVVLPRGDTDVVAAAAAQTDDLVGLAVAQSSEELDGDDDGTLLWPVDPGSAPAASLVVQSAATTRATGDPAQVPAVLVSSSLVPGAATASGWSPATAVLTATAPDGNPVSATGVLVDTTDSARVAAATDEADDDGSNGSNGAGGTNGNGQAETSARLLADTAVAAAGGGGVVLALPRDWSPSPTAVAAVLGPAGSAPWVRSTSLPDLLAAPGSGQFTVTDAGDGSADPSSAGAPLDAAGLRTAMDAVSAASTMATLVPTEQRQQLLAPVQSSATAAASVGWRADPGAWRSALDALAERTEWLRSGIEIVPTPLTAVSENVSLPVIVRNNLPVAVTVRVELSSTNLRLVPGPPVEKLIAPGSQESVPLPVRASASGDTLVTVYLTDAQGTRVGKPAPVRVMVRADWEGRGVAIAAGVVGLVLVGGLARTVVRVKRRPAPPVVRSAEEADTTRTAARRPEETPRG